MSEHTVNQKALVHATLPPLLPPGYRAGSELQLQVVPKLDVLLVPTDKIRTTPDGVVQVSRGDGTWEEVPEGFTAHELGKPLPPENCDVAIVLGTCVEETRAGISLLGANGSQPRGAMSSGPMAILARVPLLDWLRQHASVLRDR